MEVYSKDKESQDFGNKLMEILNISALTQMAQSMQSIKIKKFLEE